METVGQILRTEREKKNLTIKDAEKGTSIRFLYLNAIEEGNYSVLPGEVYLKGFIKNYADFLGLDGQKMVNIYRQEKETEIDTQEPIQTEVITTPKPSNYQFPQKSKVALAVVVCSFLVVGSWYLFSSSNSNPAAPLQTPTQVQPTQIPQQQVQTLQQAKPIVIHAKYSEPSWTLITADGKQVYEGTPKAGDTLTWDAQKNITIKLGNAGSVELIYNGQPVNKIGGKGEVAVKTFAVAQ